MRDGGRERERRVRKEERKGRGNESEVKKKENMKGIGERESEGERDEFTYKPLKYLHSSNKLFSAAFRSSRRVISTKPKR